VASVPELLEKIPDEYKPLVALGIGAFVLVGLALTHGVGLHWILVWQRRGEKRLRAERPRLVAASFLFAWSVFLMLDLHLLEILIWSFVLTHMGLIVHAYDAIYFCANGYTTLGMGKMDVEEHWRIISPIIGISGLFTFAWTTSALVDVVASNRRLLEQLEDEREREMHMRFDLRKKEWDALKTDRDAVLSESERNSTKTAGASFFQRLRFWREEKGRLHELRAQAAEIEALRRKERQDEGKLFSTPPADSPADSKDKKQQ